MHLAHAMTELANGAQTDTAIATYLEYQQQRLRSQREYENETPGERGERVAASDAKYIEAFPLAAMLDAAARHDRGRGKFVRLGRVNSEATLAAVLERLNVEENIETCLRLLWVFHRAAPPFIPDRLWQLARHADYRVRFAALVALGQSDDPTVGEFGRRLLKHERFSADNAEILRLFTRNYQPGDEAIILRALESLNPSEAEAHDIGMSIRDFCANHNSADTAGIPLWLYRTNPCTICRRDAVELLLATDSLPVAILAECEFDANEHVREIALRASLPRQ